MFLNWYSSMKKIKKDSYDFWHRKLTFESQIKTLVDTSPLHQLSKFNNFVWLCWFLSKNLSHLKTGQPVLNTYYDSIVKNTLTGDDKNMAKWRPHWMGIYACKHRCSVNKKTISW